MPGVKALYEKGSRTKEPFSANETKNRFDAIFYNSNIQFSGVWCLKFCLGITVLQELGTFISICSRLHKTICGLFSPGNISCEKLIPRQYCVGIFLSEWHRK